MQKVARILGSGILFGLIAMIVHLSLVFAVRGYYMDPVYLSVWSKLMMPTPGRPPVSFYFYALGFNMLAGILFALVYTVIGACVPGKQFISRGLMYGLLVFLVGVIPGYLALYLLINLPIGLLALWVVESFIIYLIGGVVVAKLISTYLFICGLG